MDQLNVRRWASSLRQSPHNLLQTFDNCPSVNTSPPSTVKSSNRTSPELAAPCHELFRAAANGASASGDKHHGVPNVSSPMRIKENKATNDNRKYSFTFNISSVKNDLDRQGKQHRHYKFDMTARPQEHAQASSVKQRDPDAVSDTGTYTIDDDGEPVQNIKRNPTSSILKRYVSETKARHGTFELQGKIPTRSHPVVDVNIPTRDLRSPTFSDASSGSSIHSIEDEIHLQSPATPLKSNPVRPAECFVIPPTFETKTSTARQPNQEKEDIPWRTKFAMRPTSTAARPNETLAARPSAPAKVQARVSTAPPASTPPSQQRLSSVSTTTHANEPVSHRPVPLRQQRSAVVPPTSPKVPTRPLVKQNTLVAAPTTTPSTLSAAQTNRAVELRRARAQAKIEELAQKTKKQLLKPTNALKNDVMSVSWHSNAVNGNKANSTSARPTPRATPRSTIQSERENLSSTRTLSSTVHQRSSSTSPMPPERKALRIHQPNGQLSHRMTTSAYGLETERCDTLRENGQRLAIRLIQLSSAILQKLKQGDATRDDDDVHVDELTHIVEKLHVVNQTLTAVDAALTTSTNDDAFL